MTDSMQTACYSADYYNHMKQEEPKREKRKYRSRKRSPATVERAKVVRRDKANARERKRMNSLNDALEHLRSILPQLPDEPKMTKIETLRVAQGYIKMLSEMASQSSSSNSSSVYQSPPQEHHQSHNYFQPYPPNCS